MGGVMSHNSSCKRRERGQPKEPLRSGEKRGPVLLYMFAGDGKRYLAATVTGPDTAEWHRRHPAMTEEQHRTIAAKFWQQFRGSREAAP